MFRHCVGARFLSGLQEWPDLWWNQIGDRLAAGEASSNLGGGDAGNLGWKLDHLDAACVWRNVRASKEGRSRIRWMGGPVGGDELAGREELRQGGARICVILRVEQAHESIETHDEGQPCSRGIVGLDGLDLVHEPSMATYGDGMGRACFDEPHQQAEATFQRETFHGLVHIRPGQKEQDLVRREDATRFPH